MTSQANKRGGAGTAGGRRVDWWDEFKGVPAEQSLRPRTAPARTSAGGRAAVQAPPNARKQ